MIEIDLLIKNAIKAKNPNLKYYRNLKAKILEYKTSKEFISKKKEYSDKDEITIIKSMIKQLKNSENEYFQAHREDLVADCTAERRVLENLIPQPVSQEILYTSLLSEYSFDGNVTKIQIPKKDMGIAIKMLKDRFPYNDGKEIANLVKMYII